MYLNKNSIFNRRRQNYRVYTNAHPISISSLPLNFMLKWSCHYAQYQYFTNSLYFTHITINDLDSLNIRDCLDYIENLYSPLIIITYENIAKIPYNLVKNIKKGGKLRRTEIIFINTKELLSCEDFLYKVVYTEVMLLEEEFSCFASRKQVRVN